jgi:hypothetical protein
VGVIEWIDPPSPRERHIFGSVPREAVRALNAAMRAFREARYQ